MSDIYQTLLGMMSSGKSAADTRAAILEMLSGQEGIDPATQALLARAMSDDSETGADEFDDDGDDDDDANRQRRQRAVRLLRRRFHEMEAELADLRRRNQRLRAALREARGRPSPWPVRPQSQ